MKEANCLERGMRPTLNEPDDLRGSAEPELIAGLNLLRVALEIAHCAALEKLTSPFYHLQRSNRGVKCVS